MKYKGRLLFLCPILASFFLFGCGPHKPTDENVENFLQGRLPAYLKITSIQTKSFAGPVAGTGRTSATVTLITTEPLYRQATNQDTQTEVLKHGLTMSDISQYPPYTGYWYWPPTYIAAYPQGSQFTASAEVGYQEEANGWTFDGGVNTTGIQGQPFASLPAQGTTFAGTALVLGSSDAENFFKGFVDRKNTFMEKKTKFISWLTSYFAKGQRHDGQVTEFGMSRDEAHTHQFTLTLTDDLHFKNADGQGGLEVRGNVDWHNLDPNNSFFSNYAPGAQEAVHIVGYNIVTSGAGNGQFSGFIDINRNGQNGGETGFAGQGSRQIEIGFCTFKDNGVELELGESSYQPLPQKPTIKWNKQGNTYSAILQPAQVTEVLFLPQNGRGFNWTIKGVDGQDDETMKFSVISNNGTSDLHGGPGYTSLGNNLLYLQCRSRSDYALAVTVTIK